MSMQFVLAWRVEGIHDMQFVLAWRVEGIHEYAVCSGMES